MFIFMLATGAMRSEGFIRLVSKSDKICLETHIKTLRTFLSLLTCFVKGSLGVGEISPPNLKPPMYYTLSGLQLEMANH